ncbi:MAG: LamG-like jellyroll fold domain-containing protein, partial [Bdellovibrionota bacterium]
IETVGPGGDISYDIGEIDDGACHKVTFTYSGGQVNLFKDGVLVQNATVTTPLLASDKWALGQDWDSSTSQNDRYEGLMDEIVIWSSVLSPAEIDATYRSSKP